MLLGPLHFDRRMRFEIPTSLKADGGAPSLLAAIAERSSPSLLLLNSFLIGSDRFSSGLFVTSGCGLVCSCLTVGRESHGLWAHPAAVADPSLCLPLLDQTLKAEHGLRGIFACCLLSVFVLFESGLWRDRLQIGIPVEHAIHCSIVF